MEQEGLGEGYRFEWPVDQSGYEIHQEKGDGSTIARGYEYEVIRPQGGPPRFYRPMATHPGLWRQFADVCLTRDGVLKFSNEFGLLTGKELMLDDALKLARHLRALMNLMDVEKWEFAASVFNTGPGPRLTAILEGPDARGRFTLARAPLELVGALILQAGLAITGNHIFRRCKNCSTWLKIGDRAYTHRREYCSARCRVAWGRRSKREIVDEGTHS